MTTIDYLNEAEQLQQELAQHLLRQQQARQITYKMYTQAVAASIDIFEQPTPEMVYGNMVVFANKHGLQIELVVVTK